METESFHRLGSTAVSFAHVVKAAEPVLSVILSGPLLGQTYIPLVWLSLLPIVAGCSLSAMKEVSFAWSGFNNAMLSNVGFVLRNIYSKKYLDKYEKELQITGINMYAIISAMSFLFEVRMPKHAPQPERSAVSPRVRLAMDGMVSLTDFR